MRAEYTLNLTGGRFAANRLYVNRIDDMQEKKEQKSFAEMFRRKKKEQEDFAKTQKVNFLVKAKKII
ncbi:MAG: hypothetical protein FWE23_11235 [Chitinivibrionia bacterium]|nr:hypothetical protein [Chitinivibrionia bacterium]